VHELALADAVVKAALQSARNAGIDRVASVTVLVGELQQIRTELFEYCLNEVLPDTGGTLEGTRFVVEQEPVGFRCRVCADEFGAPAVPEGDEEAREAIHLIPELSHAFVRCPRCGSPDFEVTSGRGVVLQSIEPAGGEGG